MNTTEDQIKSPQTNCSSFDFDDIDDDDDMDDDCLDSLADVQHILQTFGSNDNSTSSIDYFDSRRYEIMYEIMNIEKQFEKLKNILYEESILLMDRKLISIQNEEAPEYQDELKKLYDEMKLNLEIAKQRRLIEFQALENSTQSELISLEQTLENDKVLLYNTIREEIETKINELETLKMKTYLCTNILQEIFSSEQQQLQTITPHKKRRLNGAMKTNEKDNLAIFHRLSDIDVIEDWAIIQTSLQQSSTLSDESDINSELSENDDDKCLILMPDMDYCKEEEIDCDKN